VAGEGAERMPRWGNVIADELGAPAIVAIEEIQDDSGVADDGVVTSRATVDALVAAVRAAGGPRYDAAWIDPENRREGGVPGGNIRVVLLFDPLRAQLVRRGAAGPNDATAVAGRGRGTELTLSPGRVAASSSAFNLPSGEGVRKSLAAEFRVGSKTMFVIANHLTSKYEDDRFYGSRQPPQTPTGAKRLAQTRELRAFADSLLAADPGAKLVILGDLNEPDWAEGVAGLSRPPLANLMTTLPLADRYTYNFEGTSQAIDHVVVSQALAAGAEIDVVHRNADCPDSLRVSDHDPIVVRLKLR
jgi:predicted extracellular nuclease